MTSTMLIVFAGALLSLLFEYFPYLEGWYEKQLPQTKRLVMLLMLMLSAGVLYGFSCLGWLPSLWSEVVIVCSKSGAESLVYALILAVTANQSVHGLLKKRSDRG